MGSPKSHGDGGGGEDPGEVIWTNSSFGGMLTQKGNRNLLTVQFSRRSLMPGPHGATVRCGDKESNLLG